jgi:hypothetical protein
MTNIDDLLEDLSDYAEAITDERLDELEADLNGIKDGKGTAMRQDFVDARKELEARRTELAEYKRTQHPVLLGEANGLVKAFEELRDTGKGVNSAMSLLGRLGDAVNKVNPFDDEVVDALDKAARTSTRPNTLGRLGSSGTSRRIRFEDLADDIADRIFDLQTRRIRDLVTQFKLIQMAITQGIRALNKTAKRLEEIVKALKTLNLLIGIATRAVGLGL